jgi:ABC-2 type transport system ATP-binding protein
MTAANRSGPAVHIENLVKRFGDFVAVDNVTLDVAPGEIFGFLGPNGAGKSTTIRILCGLLPPTSGNASVGGFDVRTQPEDIKKNIGYMSQKFSLYDDLTVAENIEFFGGVYGVSREKLIARRDYVLAMAGLEDQRSMMTRLLAGGWKQRLALGCAILHEPPILFLDEPTSGVDPIARRNFWQLIYQLSAAGHTIFVTTHYMDEAEYCNRVALMYGGRIIALGSPAELKTSLGVGHLVNLVTSDLLASMTVLEKHESAKGAARTSDANRELTAPDGACPERVLRDSTANILDIAVFGGGLHVKVENAETAMPEIRALLDGAGIKITTLEPITPSMEDVFVSLIEIEEEKAAKAAKTAKAAKDAKGKKAA